MRRYDDEQYSNPYKKCKKNNKKNKKLICKITYSHLIFLEPCNFYGGFLKAQSTAICYPKNSSLF